MRPVTSDPDTTLGCISKGLLVSTCDHMPSKSYRSTHLFYGADIIHSYFGIQMEKKTDKNKLGSGKPSCYTCHLFKFYTDIDGSGI